MKITDDHVCVVLGRFDRLSLEGLCAQFGARPNVRGRYAKTARAVRAAIGRALQRLRRAGLVAHERGPVAGWRVVRPGGSERGHGLRRKYEVRRVDGSSGPGGAHEDCAYFVLDLACDEHAIPALAAYARSCKRTRPGLARDLREILSADASYPRCGCREVGCPHALSQAFHEGASPTAQRIMSLATAAGAVAAIAQDQDREGQAGPEGSPPWAGVLNGLADFSVTWHATHQPLRLNGMSGVLSPEVVEMLCRGEVPRHQISRTSRLAPRPAGQNDFCPLCLDVLLGICAPEESVAVRAATPPESGGERERDRRQADVFAWAQAAFTVEQATSLPQRGLRLLEEAIEAFQATGGDPGMAHRLVDYVFARPVGEIRQELGGVGIGVLALAAAAGVSADEAERFEVERVLGRPLEHFQRRNAEKNAAGFLVVEDGRQSEDREEDLPTDDLAAGHPPLIPGHG